MTTNEIITLQLGTLANYVGSHYWNIQQELASRAVAQGEDFVPELDHDLLYRRGKNRSGHPTFSPRCVVLDFYDQFGSLNTQLDAFEKGLLHHKDKVGFLENVRLGVDTWKNVEVFHQKMSEKPSQYIEYMRDLIPGDGVLGYGGQNVNTKKEESERDPHLTPYERLNLSEIRTTDDDKRKKVTKPSTDLYTTLQADLSTNTKYWSDYLKARFHSKSLHSLPETMRPGSSFDSSMDHSSTLKKTREAYFDSFRFFLEETDHVQGVQAFIDSSLVCGPSFLQELRDDHLSSKTSLWSFLCLPSKFDPLLEPISLCDAYEYSSLVVPLCASPDISRLSHLPDMQSGNLYHCTSVAAVTAHCITSPCRFVGSGGSSINSVGTRRVTFGELERRLRVPYGGMKVCMASLAFPFTIEHGGGERAHGGTLYDILDGLCPLHRYKGLGDMSGWVEEEEEEEKKKKKGGKVFSQLVVMNGLNEFPLYAKEKVGPGLDFGGKSLEEKIVQAFYEQMKRKHEGGGGNFGIGNLKSKYRSGEKGKFNNEELTGAKGMRELYDKWIGHRSNRSFSSCYFANGEPFWVPDSFPNVFGEEVMENGWVDGNIKKGGEKKKKKGRTRVRSLPLVSTLCAKEEVGTYVAEMAEKFRGKKGKEAKEKRRQLLLAAKNCGLEKEEDELAEYYEKLITISTYYK